MTPHLVLLLVLSSAHAVHAAPAHLAYTLPPDKLKLATALFRTRTVLHFGGAVWSILQLLLLLILRVPARLQRIAQRPTPNRWAQGFLFTLLLLLTTTLLDLPLSLYGQHLRLAYGLSVQSWGSWAGDLAKSFVLVWGLTGLAAMLLFRLIRRAPRQWWLLFWFPSMAAVCFGIFIAPVLIDPLFDHFEPLAAHDPALVERLERVVARGGLTIPPDRMFWMQASAKSTSLNAYVTGLGPSKRVVVWDTSIAQATPDQIAFIFGHEMGHYVLDHIGHTLVFLGVLLLVAFWLGSRLALALIARYGPAWSIGSPADWSALAVYLMVLAALSFVSEPLVNTFSRAQEHAADVYGQEAIHGIVADPQGTAADTFQLLGESVLDDPTAHPLVEFWRDSHPSIPQRKAFAAAYDPWANGARGRYFSK